MNLKRCYRLKGMKQVSVNKIDNYNTVLVM